MSFDLRSTITPGEHSPSAFGTTSFLSALFREVNGWTFQVATSLADQLTTASSDFGDITHGVTHHGMSMGLHDDFVITADFKTSIYIEPPMQADADDTIKEFFNQSPLLSFPEGGTTEWLDYNYEWIPVEDKILGLDLDAAVIIRPRDSTSTC